MGMWSWLLLGVGNPPQAQGYASQWNFDYPGGYPGGHRGGPRGGPRGGQRGGQRGGYPYQGYGHAGQFDYPGGQPGGQWQNGLPQVQLQKVNGVEQPGPWELYRRHLRNTGQPPPPNAPWGWENGPAPDGHAGWRGRWEQRMIMAMGPVPVIGGAPQHGPGQHEHKQHGHGQYEPEVDL